MAKKIDVSNFRHRISFEKEAKVPDGHKGFVVTWQTVCEVWASVDPLSGREYFYAQQIQNTISHRIRIRYRADITEAMRIKHAGRYFSIESIIDMGERREFLELRCQEGK